MKTLKKEKDIRKNRREKKREKRNERRLVSFIFCIAFVARST